MMTRDDFEDLLARDRDDILDILKTTTNSLPDKDALTMMLLQVRLMASFNYWTADLIAAFLGGWESEAAEEPEREKYDA